MNIAGELIEQLGDGDEENRLGERLLKLRVPTLLILDEMGYLPLDQVATSFLFQLVSKRYTQRQHHRHLEQVQLRVGCCLR